MVRQVFSEDLKHFMDSSEFEASDIEDRDLISDLIPVPIQIPVPMPSQPSSKGRHGSPLAEIG